MNQEEKQIAIAKACGWTFMGEPDYEDGALMGHHKVEGTEFLGWDMVPDYFNDLNACHEMEKTLWSRNDWSACQYQETLQNRVMASESWTWYATATQRAESFGLTLGLWKEGE